MKISIIIPLFQEEQRLQKSFQDLQSFFQKFPLTIEVVCIVDPGRDQTAAIALQQKESLQTPKVQFVIHENSQKLGRARSIQRGLQLATGDLLFLSAIDFNIPLAEYFNTIQDFLSQENLQVLIGNRLDPKKPRHGSKKSIAKFFEKIEHDKLRSIGLPLNDPTCQFMAFRKDTKEKILFTWKPNRNWFYSAEIAVALNNSGVPVSEKSVVCHDSPDSRFQWWMGLF